jgi:tol-pal system protein YbgF
LNRRWLQFVFVTAATAALSSCYGTKIFKGPIHTENTAHAVDTIRADQRRIMQRLDEMEARISAESEQRTSSNAQLSVTLRELEDAVRMLVSRIEDSEQRSSTSGRGRSNGWSRPSSSSDSAQNAADEAYKAAYGDYTRGNFELAAQQFQDYLSRYPDSPRVAESHFYLAECQFAEERFLEAAGEYQKVVRDFPASRLAPAAYLKMGRSYVQLEERSLAEKAFRTLIEKHPTSEEAKQAESALQQLGG